VWNTLITEVFTNNGQYINARYVLVNLAQLTRRMYNIYKIRGSNLYQQNINIKAKHPIRSFCAEGQMSHFFLVSLVAVFLLCFLEKTFANETTWEERYHLVSISSLLPSSSCSTTKGQLIIFLISLSPNVL